MNEIEIVQLDDFRKQRVAVLCLPGLESFLSDIVPELEKTYSVRTCYSRSMPEIESAVNWCDIAFFEWANELVIAATNNIPVMAEKQVIIRLHSYESLSNFATQINWPVVNHLIFVAEHIKEIVLKSIPKLPELVDISIVPNGVEVEYAI